MNAYRGSGGMVPLILNLSSIWRNPLPIEYEDVWVPDPDWTFWKGERSFVHARIRAQFVQLIA
jgi:hypothetical protein